MPLQKKKKQQICYVDVCNFLVKSFIEPKHVYPVTLISIK